MALKRTGCGGEVVEATIPVSSQNSKANSTIADVVGNKNDTSARIAGQPSLMNLAKGGYFHVHAPAKVYPNKADAIELTKGVTEEWGSGSEIEIIPANGITRPFDIHWIKISRISTNDQYQIDLYCNGNVIGSIAFEREAPMSRQYDAAIQIPVLASNSRVTAVLSSKGTAPSTCYVKVYYHVYPDLNS